MHRAMDALQEANLAATACQELVVGEDAMEAAVRALLVGLGEDHRREGLRRTPKRVATAFRDGTRGYKQNVKDIVQGALFPERGVDKRTGSAGGTGGQVVVRDIDHFSYCESCLLPFSIQCHVGYVPSGGRVVGLSKLSRVADVFAKRFQSPQRIANEVCSALHASIQPAGVAVAMQCWHIPLPENMKCKSSQVWIRTSHSSRSGVFEGENSSLWNDFVALLKLRGIDMEMDSHSHILPWCPLRPHEVPPCNGYAKRTTNDVTTSPKSGSTPPSNMVSAVTSILQSLGEDPLRKELVGSPQRYVQWLMRFRACNLDVKWNGFTLNSACVYERPGEDATDHGEIKSEMHLPFCAQCEHHLLPFYGVVHIGYFGNGDGKGIDRCTFQALVNFYGCKLQVQERMTRQIAEAVYSVSRRGAIVVVEANHICMISRGVEKIRSSTATIAVLGHFLTDSCASASFLQNIIPSTTHGGNKMEL